MSDQPGGPPVTTASERSTGATAAFDQPGGDDSDWTEQVTDLVVDTVDKVRDRTTGPILDISHSSVHALVAMMLLLPVSVLFAVGLVRLLNWAIPGDVWIVYAGLGTILCLVGVVLWSKRAPNS
jgi:hypothetical protein